MEILLHFSVAAIFLMCLSSLNTVECITDCQRLRQEARTKQCHPNLYVAQCDSRGKFLAKQCAGNRCFCVFPATGKIRGTYGAIKGTDEERTMDCACAIEEYLLKSPMVCQRNGNHLTRCLRVLLKARHLNQINPVCEADGTFARKQCDETKCTCVDRDGTYLGYKGLVGENSTALMDCDCARDEAEAGKNSTKIFACSKTGDYQSKCREERTLAMKTLFPFLPKCMCDGLYSPVQCLNEKCYCADTHDGDMLGHYFFDKNSTLATDANCQCARDEHMYQQLKLPMTTHCLENGNYESCIGKRYKQSLLPKVNVTEPADCNCNGNFKPVQCDQQWCYCTNIYGHHIGKFVNPVSERAQMTTCKCALDLDAELRAGKEGNFFLCDKYGNY